jgi:hypothetical protein
MKEDPGGYRALRQALKALPVPDRLPWLVATLRAASAERGALPGAWRYALGLVLTHPGLVDAACRVLEAEEPSRVHAVALRARLLNRREDWEGLRDLLARHAEEPPTGAAARRAEWLRCACLAPGADAATWARFAVALPPLARQAHDAQRHVAAGAAPDAAALRPALDAMRPPDLPAPLARLAAASSVAIVGNGSGVAGSRAAAAIEAHDFVLRLNFPVLTGHEADVGRRTDLMIFSEAKRGTLPALLAREAGYAALPAFGARTTWPRLGTAAPDQVPRPLAEAVVAMGYERPTTGFFAAVLAALVLGRRVTLFGFDFFQPGRQGHYWGDTTAAPVHELAYERWMATSVLPALCPGFRIA